MQKFVQSHRAFVKYCYHSYYGPAMTAYKIQNHNVLGLKSEEDYAWFMVPSVMRRSELEKVVIGNSFAQKNQPGWFAAFNACIDQALEDGHDSIEPAELYRLYRNQNADGFDEDGSVDKSIYNFQSLILVDAVKMLEQEFNFTISQEGKDNYLVVYGEAPDYYDPPEEEFSKEVAECVSELLTEGNYHEEVFEVLVTDLAARYRYTKELHSYGTKTIKDLFCLIDKKVRYFNVPDAWNHNGMKLKEAYRAQILLNQEIASEIELAGFESVQEAVKHFLLDEQFGRDEDED